MTKTFHGSVVRVPEPYLCAEGKRISVRFETVVLACYKHPPCTLVPDRMIAAVMTEFHLSRSASQGMGDQLVPEAYAEYGHLSQKLPNTIHESGKDCRVSGSI